MDNLELKRKCIAREDYLLSMHTYDKGALNITLKKGDVFDYKKIQSINGFNETIVEYHVFLSDADIAIDGGAYGSFGVVTSYYNGVLLKELADRSRYYIFFSDRSRHMGIDKFNELFIDSGEFRNERINDILE